MAVFGIRFAHGGVEQLAQQLASTSVEPGQGVRNLITPNLEHIVQMTRDPRLRQAYDRAWLAIPDGVPVYLYAKLRGEPLAERVAGSTLFDRLIRLLNAERHRCFFVCPTATVKDFYDHFMAAQGFASDAVRTVVPPFGFDADSELSAVLADDIHDFQPTHVFFGVSSVRSEIWVHRYRELLGDCYVLCVGAALEFTAGIKSRAPTIVQRSGLEWAWRFVHEPRRLFRRYFLDSWVFLRAVRDDLAR
jgi:N-acetylglucosaminyldiphosphoundecaprenol N-acetyl-beta-D-mannosaminyltransferase